LFLKHDLISLKCTVVSASYSDRVFPIAKNLLVKLKTRLLVQIHGLVHGNGIPMGIPRETSHVMGQHTFVFPMRLRNRMRVSACY